MDEWRQTTIEHCPNVNCKGMLLQNDEKSYWKCSDCGTKFIFVGEWRKV